MSLSDIVKSYLETPAKDDKFSPFKPIVRCGPKSCHDGSKPYAIMLDEEKEWFGNKSVRLKGAIKRGVESKYICGLHHGHQKRMRTQVYDKATVDIQAKAPQIENVINFDDLYEEIKSCLEPIKYVGPMAYYDFALRIGWFLGVEPERVYLQQGALEGYRSLEKKSKNVTAFKIDKMRSGALTVQPSALPSEMHKLSAVQTENVLCIYKDKF